MTTTMHAARLHEVGKPLQIDDVPIPEPGPDEVLVSVRAVNIVPNLANVLTNWSTWFPQMPLPDLPAVFGLDASGVVEAVGAHVEGNGIAVGDRVYVNPERHCGICAACSTGDVLSCSSAVLAGYFGTTPRSRHLVNRYGGGLAEKMIAPAYAIVHVPDNVPFETAARLGYLGTMYSTLRQAGAAPGKTLLVNGISGTLGIGAAIFGPAFGLTKIYGTGRDRDLLKRVEQLAPGRIEVHSLDDGPVDAWIRDVTGGAGVDMYVDALGTGAPKETFLEGMSSVRKGGTVVNVGAVDGDVPINLRMLGITLSNHFWFTTAEGQQMMDLVAVGVVDLNVFEHHINPLTEVNEAISDFSTRHGGFSNFVICPATARRD